MSRRERRQEKRQAAAERGRRLVLDTSCVRGTSRPILHHLRDRGFSLVVSTTAVSELAVHRIRASQNSSDATALDRVWKRIRAIRELLDREEPIAPTHAGVILTVGGRIADAPPFDLAFWRANITAAWNALADETNPIPAPALESLRRIASYVEDTGADFVRTMAFGVGPDRTDVFDGVDERQFARLCADDMGRLWSRMYLVPDDGPDIRERFDAWMRVSGLHGRRAHERATGRRRRFEPNHATDLTLLHHLAEGLPLVTRDYELIEEVDASGSFQAPWVRTPGEVVEGRLPLGLPFGQNGRKALAQHRRRRRADLHALDAAIEVSVRDLVGATCPQGAT